MIAAGAVLTHVTLTTGKCSHSRLADVPYRDVELLKPMVAARLGACGGFDFAVTAYGDGAASFLLGEPSAKSPAVACALCWLPARSAQLWRILTDAMKRRGIVSLLEAPPLPWLVVALLPEGLTELTRRNLSGEGPRVETLMAAERAIAWALLENELGSTWC